MPDPNKEKTIWRRDILGWSCYDCANSGYTTLMITVFVFYIQRVVFNEQAQGATGAVVWAWAVAISMLVGAVLSPLVGAMADERGGKRFGLGLTALTGGLACIAMALVPTQSTWLVVGLFVAANLSLELSLTFYNGFLPEIADEDELNRVSSIGMSLGYFGGGLGLLLALIYLGNGTEAGPGQTIYLLRVCMIATGIWWIVFTIPTVVVLRDAPRRVSSLPIGAVGRKALSDVMDTIRSLRTKRNLLFFLVAFLIYNDGLQTVISQASTFALKELAFTERDLIGVVLMIQFVATPGAILIGWLADFVGRKRALVFCLLVWIVLLTLAWFVETKHQYWWLAGGVAIVLGGTQSISRAIMGSLTPPGEEARYFGFFNLSGKATSFIGTFFFGLVVAVTGSARLAIVGLVIFFVVGMWIILQIDLRQETEP